MKKKGLHDSSRGEKDEGGDYKNQRVQEKIEHERETDATLTKGRE